MEVLKSIWHRELPHLLKGVGEADFIAIDSNVESTGFLRTDESLNMEELQIKENEDCWYSTLKSKEKTRSPLEFGVAAFKYLKDEDRFEVKAWNIPILLGYVQEHDARQQSRDDRDPIGGEERLDLSPAGWEFMEQTNFDLNKTLYEGVPFINKERAEQAREYIRRNPDFMVIEGKHVKNGELDGSYFPKVMEEVKKEEDIEEIIERFRGIGRIFEGLKVPIVGHNLLIKLILMYKDFVEFLPKDYEEYKTKLEKVVPIFYDTKLMSQDFHTKKGTEDKESGSEDSTTLYSLYRALFQQKDQDIIDDVRFTLDEEAGKVYESDLQDLLQGDEVLEDDPTSFCYECGFDAVIAGMIFIKLLRSEFGNFSSCNIRNLEVWKNKVFIPKEIIYG